MSVTQDYKTVSFPDQGAFVVVITALQMYITELDRIAGNGGGYSNWPNGQAMRNDAVRAKVLLERAE